MIADKGYDSDTFCEFIINKGEKSGFPKRHYKNTAQLKVDWCLYRYRHLVENAFGRIKRYRAISNGYDKLTISCASMVSLVFTLI